MSFHLRQSRVFHRHCSKSNRRRCFFQNYYLRQSLLLK